VFHELNYVQRFEEIVFSCLAAATTKAQDQLRSHYRYNVHGTGDFCDVQLYMPISETYLDRWAHSCVTTLGIMSVKPRKIDN